MSRRVLHTLIAISILTFFLQAMRAAFSTLFGIIYDQIFEEQMSAWLPVSNLLVVAAMLTPLLARWLRGSRWLAVSAAAAALARIALTVNEASVRYWGAVIVLAAGGLYLALLLIERRDLAFAGLIGALVLDQVLRAAGDTFDISLREFWLPVQIVWSALAAGLAIWLVRTAPRDAAPAVGLPWWGGLALGAWFYLETSLLALPNGIARWSGTPYPVIAPMLVALTVLPMLLLGYAGLRRAVQSRGGRVVMALVLVLGLMAGYFLTGIAAGAALLAAQVANLGLLLAILAGGSAGARSAGPSLALGLFLFVVLNFFNAFAFTYPYLLPVMRGMGWAVYLAAAVVIGLAAAIPTLPAILPADPPLHAAPAQIAGALALIIVLVVTARQPVTTYPDTDSIRVATYNIHYGYDDVWHTTLEDIAQTIAAEGADIVMMQEVDTGRMTSYLVDNAYFLARRLRMNVRYLPTVEHLTGIAILYRDPVILTDSALITSQQEQTGIVLAQVEVRGRPLNAYGIWMGLDDEDTQTQIEEALAFIGDSTPAVFGGDFNAEPGSPVAQAIEAAGFVDPVTVLGLNPEPFTSPAPQPTHRIDFVWVRDLTVIGAWVPESVASDHRMMVIEVEAP